MYVPRKHEVNVSGRELNLKRGHLAEFTLADEQTVVATIVNCTRSSLWVVDGGTDRIIPLSTISIWKIVD